jgi:glycine cleavage system H protein
MNSKRSTDTDQYYTKDHEWIDFQGIVAFIGICKFKLTGFKQIQSITFNEATGYKKQGDVIATIVYEDYKIEAHMPVDGKILQVNSKLVTGNLDILLDCSESSAWIALIEASDPMERNDLLLSNQYKMSVQSAYAKQ